MNVEIMEYDSLPQDFWNVGPHEAYKVFPKPCLVHLKGEIDPPVLFSILLHGNETTSWLALQKLLARYKDKALPRSVSLLIGNVDAAKEGVRRKANQEDYNRIWSEGTSNGNLFAQAILSIMKKKGVFLNVDVHNNTGKNPYYACVSELDDPFIELAKEFSNTVVYFKRPREAQSTYFSQLCPSVTLESGKVGDEEGVERVVEFLDKCLNRKEFSDKVNEEGLSIFHSVTGLLVPRGFGISFGSSDESKDLQLIEKFEELNFQQLPENFLLGHCKVECPLIVVDEHNNDVTKEYLNCENGEIRLKRAMTPAMLTEDLRVIRQDCLGYLMQKFVRK